MNVAIIAWGSNHISNPRVKWMRMSAHNDNNWGNLKKKKKTKKTNKQTNKEEKIRCDGMD